MRRQHSFSTIVAAGLAVAIVLACSGSGSAHFANGTGTIQVHLTDSPIDLADVRSVNVTITEVTVYPGDSPDPMPGATPVGPVAVLTHPETFDLLTLTGGATTLLASGEVPAGDYARIRLGVSDASLVHQDGTVVPLKLDSGKVDVPIAFHVAIDTQNVVTLDFDAAASVQVNNTASGAAILRPVVTPVY